MPRRHRVRGLVVVVLAIALIAAACGDDDDSSSSGSSSVDAAQQKVTSAEKAVASAQSDFENASDAFCSASTSYVDAVDRYGKVFDQDAATVGDVQTLGADLADPRAEVTDAAADVTSKKDALDAATADLEAAKTDLARAQAAAGSSTTAASTTTTTEPKVEPASIDRVKKAEADLADAQQGITAETRLTEAAVEYTSAAFAVEAAWLNLLNDAGCLTDDQQAKAAQGLHDYTVAVQRQLSTAELYTGEIDGVYGPATVAAVKQLQTDAGLPVTGLVDQATSVALDTAAGAKSSAAGAEVETQVTALQTVLKLAGYWSGPIDGAWTAELSDAVKELQRDLGVEPTGTIDAATLAAIEEAIAAAGAEATTTTTAGAGGGSSTTEATTTSAP